MNAARYISMAIIYLIGFEITAQPIDKISISRVDPTSYNLTFKKKFKGIYDFDTSETEITVSFLKINEHSYYRISDHKNKITYINDSTGFYIYTHKNNVLAKGIEPAFFFRRKCYKYINGSSFYNLFDSFYCKIDTSCQEFNTFSFDSISFAKNDYSFDNYSTLYLKFNKKKNVIDEITEKIWFDGNYQYSKITLFDLVINPRNIYDSIKIDNLSLKILNRINFDTLISNSRKKTDYLKGQKFPSFNLIDYDGTFLNISKKKSNTYIIDFQYIGCYPCVVINEKLKKLREKYSEKQVYIIGVNTIDTLSNKVKEHYTSQSLNYPISFTDFTQKKYVQNFVSEYPTIFVLDKNFLVVDILIGSDDSVISHIKELIDNNN